LRWNRVPRLHDGGVEFDAQKYAGFFQYQQGGRKPSEMAPGTPPPADGDPSTQTPSTMLITVDAPPQSKATREAGEKKREKDAGEETIWSLARRRTP